MNSSRFSALLLAFACVALGACTQGTDDAASTAADQTTSCNARATYDKAVNAAEATLQASYAQAMTQFNQDVADAAAKRDATFATLPKGDTTSDLYNQAVLDYDAAVATDGPIEQAYNARVAADQDQFNKTVKAAAAAYNASAC